jgi:hypothetical protein
VQYLSFEHNLLSVCSKEYVEQASECENNS